MNGNAVGVLVYDHRFILQRVMDGIFSKSNQGIQKISHI